MKQNLPAAHAIIAQIQGSLLLLKVTQDLNVLESNFDLLKLVLKKWEKIMKKLDMIVIGSGSAPPTAVIRRKSLCQQLNLKKRSRFCRPMRFGENIPLPMFKKDGKVVKHS